MKSTLPEVPEIENITLCLMNHYIKRIPIDRNHVQLKLYGVNTQIEYSEGVYNKFQICTQLDLCIFDEEDDNDYYNSQPKKKSGKTFFYHINHSLLEAIQFEFSDGSVEEIKIPLVSQKIYYDVCNDLHLCLAEPQSFPTIPNSLNSKSITINYN